ncbi:cobalamin B12-binding domain-containing protein [Streptomyces silvensis]|uniref:Cobalamin-binding protein n=1 Tax=Streptomyces silvensis TaxID=1765722 RepID=A0A0W7X5L0_9ACTN|nr:cobalamin B12-binding domain-containing protein [Streptomyces silvensis]KUF17986.1 cobalamin-binding protein [Streptomyces silvensis]
MTSTATAPDGRAAYWADELWDTVVAGDEPSAAWTAFAALRAGLDKETVLLDVIGAVQRRVGKEWADNRMTVAQEHAATAINERVVAALARSEAPPGAPAPPAPRSPEPPAAAPGSHDTVSSRHDPAAARPYPGGSRPGPGEPARPRITVSCVDGEWHALPARLLAEVLSLRGWHVDFLGAQVPTAHLVTHLHHTGADVVALSGSLATRLPTAHAAISACRSAGVPVLAGGAAFGPGGRHAELLGADLWASDARSAAARLAGGPPPRPAGDPLTDESLKHLLDQEYTLISRAAGQLVRATLQGVGARYPAMRDYTAPQQQHTAEDVAHIVAFLGAALYVDDGDMFTAFACWTNDILAARHVPTESLLHALDVLGAEVRDFPRATAMLRQAAEVLRTPGPGE